MPGISIPWEACRGVDKLQEDAVWVPEAGASSRRCNNNGYILASALWVDG